jgi:hypothetical protein
MKQENIGKYVSATLLGAEVFDSHKEALEHYRGKTSELKGVFRIGKTKRELEGINVSGSFNNINHAQLKNVAWEKGKGNPADFGDVFMYRSVLSEDAVFLAGVDYDSKKEVNNLIAREKKENITASYLLVDNLEWAEESKKEHVLVSDVHRIRISTDPISIIHSTTGTSMEIPWPYVSLDDAELKSVPLEGEEVLSLLKSSVHRAVEITESLMSLGWKAQDIIPNAREEIISLRDDKAPDVWKKYSYSDALDLGQQGIKSSLESSMVGEVEASRIKP